MSSSLSIHEDVVVVGRHAPVFVLVVLVWEVLLVVGEERVELDALLEVLDSLETPDILEHVEVAKGIHASTDETVPVDALELDVGVVLLERKGERLAEIDVGPLDRVHVLTSHLELVEVEVLWKDLHLILLLLVNSTPLFSILNVHHSSLSAARSTSTLLVFASRRTGALRCVTPR